MTAGGIQWARKIKFQYSDARSVVASCLVNCLLLLTVNDCLWLRCLQTSLSVFVRYVCFESCYAHPLTQTVKRLSPPSTVEKRQTGKLSHGATTIPSSSACASFLSVNFKAIVGKSYLSNAQRQSSLNLLGSFGTWSCRVPRKGRLRWNTSHGVLCCRSASQCFLYG